MTARQRDSGAYLVTRNALNPVTVTAGTTADGQERNGFIIDRLAFNDLILSCKVTLPYNMVLSTADTGTVAANFQDSASSASTAFADYADKDGSTGVSVVRTTAGPLDSILEFDVDLSSARQFVRVQVTPTMSSTATDTLDIGGVLVFGGGDNIPPA